MEPNLRLTDEQRRAVEEFRRRHRTAVLALLFTDVAGSTALRGEMGELPASTLLERYRALVREVLSGFAEAEEISTAGDSIFAVFNKPSDAVRFSLLTQMRLRELAAAERPDFRVHIGIHLGEVFVEEEVEGGPPRDILGMQVDIAARATALAGGGQILMTRGVFDNARQILKGQLLQGIGDLSWLSHGPYLLKGFDEPLAICEVGETRTAPLQQPDDCDEGKRVAVPGAEPVLGWRPAVEQRVPGTDWILEEKLGEGGFGEVWRGRHLQTKEIRVFKFCFHADRLRNLKREMTLFRILKEVLGARDDIARLCEVQFGEAPYYLELEYTPGGNLRHWIETRGGFEAVPLELRLEIVAQIATALAAAHSVGVIHKDVKPTNVLIEERGEGVVQARLTDFGIGQLLDHKALERAGITATSITDSTDAMTRLSSRTGTRLYMAPELVAGRQPSIQSDLYSLGVLLYQLIVGDFSQPMTTDWQRHIEDPLLRDDLRHCLAGDPSERLGTADELARRLRTLAQRRAALAEQETAERSAERRRKAARVSAAGAALLALLAIALGYGLWRERVQHGKTIREQYYTLIGLADKRIGQSRFEVARKILASCPEKYRHWEWGLCQHLASFDRITLSKHSRTVYSVAFSPDDKRLATASGDRTAILWDVETGRPIRTFEGHTGRVWSVAISPDGKRLATASEDATAKLWDIETGVLIRTFEGHTRAVTDVTFSPDGTQLATASHDTTAKLWDVETTRPPRSLRGYSGRVWAVAFSPDGRFLATGSDHKAARLWNLETPDTYRTIGEHSDVVSAVAFSPDGRFLATGSWDGMAKIWDVETGNFVQESRRFPRAVTSVVFSPDGKRFAAGSDDTMARLWDVETGNEIVSNWIWGHSGRVWDVAFSSDGMLLATASSDHTAKIWDLDVPRNFMLLRGGADPEKAGVVHAVAFGRGGRLLATATEDGSARLWDTLTHRKLLTLPGLSAMRSLAFSPAGDLLATGFSGGTVRIWDVETGQKIRDIAAHKYPVSGVAFNSGGSRLATASGRRDVSDIPGGETVARIWDVKTGRLIASLKGHTQAVNCVAFSPDGSCLATGSWDETVRLWDARTNRLLQTFGGENGEVHCVAFSPDGSWVVAGNGDGTAIVWHVKTGRMVRPPLHGHNDAILSMAFSPDGKRLATASYDQTTELWDMETGHAVLTLGGTYAGEVEAVAFSQDGRHLATGGASKKVYLWTSFPWKMADYPQAPNMTLEDRIESYKHRYRKEWLAALRKRQPVAAAQRLLDAQVYSPGLAIRVRLNLSWGAPAARVKVVENVPEGWAIEGVSHSGTVRGNTIAWDLTPWTSPGMTLDYEVTPPKDLGSHPVRFTNARAKPDSGRWVSIKDTSLRPAKALVFQKGVHPHPTYDGCDDAHILVHFAGNNTGGYRDLEEGGWPGGNLDHKKMLVRFDLRSVPSTFSLGRAELRLFAFDERVCGHRTTHTVYVARLLKRWNAGTGDERHDGRPAQAGEVTFVDARNKEESWEVPGALGDMDVDGCESSTTVTANWPGWVTLDVTESVRDFLKTPARNRGWKISQDRGHGMRDEDVLYATGIYEFKSSQAPEILLRPVLTLIPTDMTDRARSGAPP